MDHSSRLLCRVRTPSANHSIQLFNASLNMIITTLRANFHQRQRQRVLSLSHIATSFSKRYSSDDSVTIGDITVDKPPRGNAPNLIPNLPSGLSEHHDVNASLPTCHLSHLRWMMQKDLILGQDFLLLGTPDLARDRYVVCLYRFSIPSQYKNGYIFCTLC